MNSPSFIFGRTATRWLVAMVFGFSFQLALQADVVVLKNGAVITGTILQQDRSGILLRMEYGTFRYPPALVQESKKTSAPVPFVSNNGRAIPDWAQIVTLLADQPWATEIKQVPGTVIPSGVFKNVPYVSFRCASGGYEVNIYGDLNHPAAIQVGALNYLRDKSQSKTNCVDFICSLLPNADDRERVRSLNWTGKDVKQNGSLCFETVLPGESGSFGGWWVRIHDPAALMQAAASDAELQALTQPRVVAPSPALPVSSAPSSGSSSQPAAADTSVTTTTNTTVEYYGWTTEEVAVARPAAAAAAVSPVVNPAVNPAVNPVSPVNNVYPRTYNRAGGTYGRRR